MNLAVVGDALLDRDVHGTVTRVSPDAPVPVFDEKHVTAGQLAPAGGSAS